LLAALCVQGEVVSFEELSNLKTLDNTISLVKLVFLALSAVLFCLFSWHHYISPPPKYAELTTIEGKVMQKKLHRDGKYSSSEEYRLWIMTDIDEMQVTIPKGSVKNCCFLDLVPQFEKVNLLVDFTFSGIKLYQITHGNKVILDGHDELLKEKQGVFKMLYAALVLFLIGGTAYLIEAFRKIQKNT